MVLFEDVINLTNDTYNIYRYNEATMTWENSLYSGNSFDRFENGPGYLYRRNTEATLEFDGYFYNTYAFYLHVIVRLTGNDMDMLAQNTYSFIGSPADAENRFIVKLSANTGVSDDCFAYQSGEDIIVCGEGILQVYDVTGRMVSTQRISGVELVEKPSQNGIYIFRLLGNEVKTQKILVK